MVVCPIVIAVPGEFTCTTDADWTSGHGLQIAGMLAHEQEPITSKTSNVYANFGEVSFI